MPRRLDHVVHAVRDLDGAAALYRRLGFAVGARNRHPWGTHNRIVQMTDSFIELLAVAEPEKLDEDAFSALFGTFHRLFLQRQQGLSFVVLESRGAAADARAFRAAGIGVSVALSFEREGRRADGTSVKIGYSAAFARDAKATQIGFAAAQQHYPENFWDPALQRHPNTAAALAGVILVAENPADHHIFLSAFVGERALLATSSGIALKTPRGEIQVMHPDAFRSHFGVTPPDVAQSARLAAVRIALREPETGRRVLQEAGVHFNEVMGRLVIAPEEAMGATLAFEPAA
jgi:hypothetical protein